MCIRASVGSGRVGLTESPPNKRLVWPLEGSGKVHGHVKVRSVEDVANPELEGLMKAALKAARTRNKADGSRGSSSAAAR
jgi:hypothetical protein